jgi:SPP1 gp7 family putative phage head morphogenesis protein
VKVKGVKQTGSLLDAELEMALWIQRLSIGIERDVMRAADKWLKAITIELQATGEISGLTKRQFYKLQKSIELAGKDVMTPALEQVFADLDSVASAAAKSEAVIIGSAISGKVKALERAFAAAVATPIAATGDMLKPFVFGLEATMLGKFEREIRISMATGRTLSESVEALKGSVVTMKARDIEAVISTATQHTFNMARDAVYELNGIDKVRCVATLDVRVCSACAALDGLIVSRSQSPAYPLHPRCRCLTIPEIAGMEKFKEGATRAGADGYVSESVTALDWLRGKSTGDLEDAYGPTVAAAIKSDGMTNTKFRQLSLDKALRPISAGELKKRMEKKGLL